MRFIAHRGNINKKIEELENTHEYIFAAISKGYDVEIDVWVYNNDFYLGHNFPKIKTDLQWMIELSENLWIHAKNISALTSILSHKCLNCFMHDTDVAVLTSHGYIWQYPGVQYETSKSIIVKPELSNIKEDLFGVAGICSDNIEVYRRLYE